MRDSIKGLHLSYRVCKRESKESLRAMYREFAGNVECLLRIQIVPNIYKNVEREKHISSVVQRKYRENKVDTPYVLLNDGILYYRSNQQLLKDFVIEFQKGGRILHIGPNLLKTFSCRNNTPHLVTLQGFKLHVQM